MAALTGRWTALEDLQLFEVGGIDATAVMSEGTLEVTVDEIAVDALKDEWRQREYGQKDWRVTARGLTKATAVFVNLVLAGAPVVVSALIGDGLGGSYSFLGTGIITGAPLTIGNPITQEITITSAGGAPTIDVA